MTDKVSRSVGLGRFGRLLGWSCVIGGAEICLRHGFAFGVEARAAGVRVKIGVDCGEGAEEQVADVGEEGGGGGGDASLGHEGVEGGEGMVDALGVLEAAGFFGQGRQEVLGVARLGSRVSSAEGATRVGNHGTALAAGGGAALASLRGEVGAG